MPEHYYHFHIHPQPDTPSPGELRILAAIERLENRMSQELTDLQAAVAAETTVDQSAVTLLTGLKVQLDVAIAAAQNGDTTALPALSASLGKDTAALSAAVAANTPAATPAPATGSTSTAPLTTSPSPGMG